MVEHSSDRTHVLLQGIQAGRRDPKEVDERRPVSAVDKKALTLPNKFKPFATELKSASICVACAASGEVQSEMWEIHTRPIRPTVTNEILSSRMVQYLYSCFSCLLHTPNDKYGVIFSRASKMTIPFRINTIKAYEPLEFEE